MDGSELLSLMNRNSKPQLRPRTLPEGEYRQRCYSCYRPVAACFCDSIPKVANQTDVLILQHQRERSHPFNTARIVNKALERCELLFDRNESFARRKLPIIDGAVLLYPGKESKLINELSADHKPTQLVIIDGTWDQAKTLFRDIPQLQTLPQYKLAPPSPGQYRIRLEPSSTSLSTLEATVQSLQHLEPDTKGLDKLVESFNRMVEQQLAHPNANYGDGSPRPKVETLNVPASFCRDPARIVVAWGESTPVENQPGMPWKEFNHRKKAAAKLPPVFWIAQRLAESPGQSQNFCVAIKPQDKISPQNLRHLNLKEADIASGVELETFRQRWQQFLHPDDLLVVPNQQSMRLLESAGVTKHSGYELLKSINCDPRNEFSGVGEFLDSIPWPVASPTFPGRAGQRLAHAISLVKYLISQRKLQQNLP